MLAAIKPMVTVVREYTRSVERSGIMRGSPGRRGESGVGPAKSRIQAGLLDPAARFIQCRDAPASSQTRAIQRRHGVRKFKRLEHRRPVEHRITKRSMKHVARARGIHRIYRESR